MVAAFDVSKDFLDLSLGGRVSRIENRPEPIERFLSGLPSDTVVAVESTGIYHRLVANSAYARGFCVYVAPPKKLVAYRKSESVRGKTDRLDAQLLETYILEKQDRLHPYKPSDDFSEALRELTGRRQAVVKAKVQALSSLEGSPLLAKEREALEASFKAALGALEKQISSLLAKSEKAAMLLEVPGFGNTVVAGLLGLLERYDFQSADAFVAYLGMDPRPSDSGRRRGTRYVTCDGDAAVRSLLYNAALSGARTSTWSAYYQQQRAKGLAHTECLLILGRKMARTAWSIHKHNVRFQPDRLDKRT